MEHRRVEGWRNQQLGQTAENTFRDVLATWMSPEHAKISTVAPDNRKIDLTHSIPSRCADIGELTLNWQIKSTSGRPRVVNSKLLSCPCFQVSIGTPNYMRELFKIALGTERLYLAFGVANLEPTELLNEAPLARFEWYALDLHQYCKLLDPERIPSRIDVPICNRLNLGLFSLLWGANWVDTYLDPLRRDGGSWPRSVQKLVALLSRPHDEVAGSAAESLRLANSDVIALARSMPRFQYKQLTSLIAIFGSLRAVIDALNESGRVDLIANYCPESLGGTVNLWLFSRLYHEFMFTTQMVGLKNVRFLPVAYETMEDIPRYYQAALYNVRRLYTALRAEVKIVRQFSTGGGDDFSYYSGAVRPFPWMQVDRSGHVSVENARMSGKKQDREKLFDSKMRILADRGLDPGRGGHFGALLAEEVLLGKVAPVCLFPREDAHFEYPQRLWGGPVKEYRD